MKRWSKYLPVFMAVYITAIFISPLMTAQLSTSHVPTISTAPAYAADAETVCSKQSFRNDDFKVGECVRGFKMVSELKETAPNAKKRCATSALGADIDKPSCEKGVDLAVADKNGQNTAPAEPNKPNVTPAQLQTRAETYCKGERGTEAQEKCAAGFKDGFKGEKSKKASCGTANNASTVACGIGFAAGVRYANGEEVGTTVAGDPATDSAKSDEDAADKCAADAVSFGWLLCPAIDLLNKAIGTLTDKFLVPLLEVAPTTDNDNLKALWANMRNLANLFFVFIFLVIIFANVLSININAYAVKKMLPKLVAAAVMVQFSFLICSLIVDVGNVLGVGVNQITNLVSIDPSQGSNDVKPLVSLGYGLGVILTGAIAFTAAAIITIPGVLLLGFTALISLLGVALVLVLRQLIIATLIVLSPLAFAAWVLPNTEGLFKSWYKNLIRLSLMYPLIILFLSVAGILAQASAQSGGWSSIVGAFFPIIAFFSIPFTFRLAGGILSTVSNVATGKTKQMRGAAQSRFGEDVAKRRAEINANRAAGLQGRVFGRTLPGGRRVMTGVGRIGTGRISPGGRTRAGIALDAQKQVEDSSKLFQAGNLNWDTLEALATGSTANIDRVINDPNSTPTQKAVARENRERYRQFGDLARTDLGRAGAAHAMLKTGGVSKLPSYMESLRSTFDENDTRQSVQGDMLWRSAVSPNHGDVNKADPILAQLGWQKRAHTQEAAQSVLDRVSGDKLAEVSPDGLKRFQESGALLSPTQISSVSTDNARARMNQKQRDTVVDLIDQSILTMKRPDTGPMGGTPTPAQIAEANQDYEARKHNARLRYDLDQGHIDPRTVRGDAVVREMLKKYGSDTNYKALVDNAVQNDTNIPPA